MSPYLKLIVVLLMLCVTVLAAPLDYDPTDPRKSDDKVSPIDPEEFKLLKIKALLKLFLAKSLG